MKEVGLQFCVPVEVTLYVAMELCGEERGKRRDRGKGEIEGKEREGKGERGEERERGERGIKGGGGGRGRCDRQKKEGERKEM